MSAKLRKIFGILNRIKAKYILAAAVALLFAPLASGLPAPAAATPSAAQDSTSIRRSAAASSDTAAAPERPRRAPRRRAATDTLRTGVSGDAAAAAPDSVAPALPGDAAADTARRGSRGSFLDDIITGRNRDSLVFEVQRNVVHIYNEGDVTYQSSNLKADYMRIDMDSKEIHAYGKADTVEGRPTTTHPVFQEGSASYTMDTITYNIDTKKAKIKGVATQEGDGWLIGGSVKKMADNTINIQDGKYTTCDHTDHPHFYLAMTKAKVIPGKKVVTGPAYLVMEDVPIYFLGIPEGFFPISSGPKSGLLMPTYGEEYTKGFFLRDLGYYFTFGDKADLALRGGIYTLGSWEAKAASNYVKRYKYSGNLNFDYSSVRVGEKGEPDYIKQNNVLLKWTHQQDPKANPGSTFSASVNFATSGFGRYSASSINDILATQTNSTISYSKNWAGTPFSLSANMAVSQNSSTEKIDITLPNIVFNVSRFKPFARKEAVGKERWYEKITMSYTAKMTNRVNTKESEVFSKETLHNMSNGIEHTLPVSASFNLFNYINVSPSFNYTERWFVKRVEQQYNPATGRAETLDPEYGFWRLYNYNASLSATTTLYGMYETRKRTRKLQAVRHTITPTVGFSYAPDFRDLKYGFWRTVQTDSLGNHKLYSPYSGVNAFGVPSASESASMNFSLNQTLEMKVLSKRDTSGVRKVKIIDELALSSSYNFLADSMGLSNIGVSFRSSLIKNFGIKLGATLDPYRVTPDGRRYNKLFFPGRVTSTGWSFNYTFQSSENRTTPALNDITTQDPLYANPFIDPYGRMDPALRRQYMAGSYYDFSIPWNLGVGYNINYSVQYGNYPPKGYKSIVDQSIQLNGSFNITPKTGISVSTGYSFRDRDFTLTSINISRDLHCWQMSFSWIPFGAHRSWSFYIGVKASSLSDLKYDKSQSMYDNLY